MNKAIHDNMNDNSCLTICFELCPFQMTRMKLNVAFNLTSTCPIKLILGIYHQDEQIHFDNKNDNSRFTIFELGPFQLTIMKHNVALNFESTCPINLIFGICRLDA